MGHIDLQNLQLSRAFEGYVKSYEGKFTYLVTNSIYGFTLLNTLFIMYIIVTLIYLLIFNYFEGKLLFIYSKSVFLNFLLNLFI